MCVIMKGNLPLNYLAAVIEVKDCAYGDFFHWFIRHYAVPGLYHQQARSFEQSSQRTVDAFLQVTDAIQLRP